MALTSMDLLPNLISLIVWEDKLNKTKHDELAGYIDSKIIKGLLVINPSFRAQYYASLRNFSPEPRLGIKYNVSEKLIKRCYGAIFSKLNFC